jgi:hypothetical protein
MGMPRTVYPEGFGMDEVGETAKVGEPPQGNEEAVVVSTLPVLHVSWDSRVSCFVVSQSHRRLWARCQGT